MSVIYETPETEIEVPEFRKVADTAFTQEQVRTIFRRGYEELDQLFTSEHGGTYNASLFYRLYESFPEHFTRIVLPLDQDLFDYIVRNIEIDRDHMLSLSAEAASEPLRVVTLNDPVPNYIIDGHHRLVRLYLEGFRRIYAIIGDRFISHRCHVVRGTA